MAPARKKSVNKRSLDEVPPDATVKNSNKNKELVIGKRTLADKLGRRWSEAELQRFYRAFRVHGVDWKKVAAEVPNRSIEMVHALYKMNKAYLSLPEGIASVVGLIAMMTDHYSTMEVSDSERESNDVPRMSHKSQKRKRSTIQMGAPKGLRQSHSLASTDRYLSLLKIGPFNGGQPRAVGKRTPRVAICRENYRPPKNNGNDNDDGAQVAALALTEAMQRGVSAQVSCTPCRRIEHLKSSPVRSWDKMLLPSKSCHMKLHNISVNDEWIEDHIRRGSDNGTYAWDTSSSVNMEGMGTVEVHRRGKKFHGHNVKVEEISNCQSDDGGEACSGTEECPKISTIKVKVNINESNVKIDHTYPLVRRKRRDNVSRDEFSALDALHTLASLSVMESESSVQLNEERPLVNVLGKSSMPETTITSHHKDRAKTPGRKGKKLHEITEVEGVTSRNGKLGRQALLYVKPVSDPKQQPQLTSSLKRKRSLKAPDSEAPINLHLNQPLVAETMDEDDVISTPERKRSCQVSEVPEQVKASEGSSNGDQSSASGVAISTAQASAAIQVTLPTRKTRRRKRDLNREYFPKDGNASDSILKSEANRSSISGQDRSLHPKENLSTCLSSPMVRRWCTFEWFYSAIDYPWFAKREFVEYLNHVGLGHIPRLTRVEWGVIRSSLGKPRRFSEHFLTEEREKLKRYRDSVRKHYTELRTGVKEGLPTDLAKPLSVGEQVIAMHPRTRELCNGSVLTVDHDRCRIQFDCPEMGVEFVKDVDCMPLNPFDNMPESLRRHTLCAMPKELQMNRRSNIDGLNSTRHWEKLEGSTNALVKQVDANSVQAKPAVADVFAAAQVQPMESNIRALSELNYSLDKKASSALLNLRQRDRFLGNTLPPWMKLPVTCNLTGGPSSSHHGFVSQESGSTVVEIVRGSRHKAHTMIDAAVQAISSVKEGEDTFVKIEEALHSIDRRHGASESTAQVIRSPEHEDGIILHDNQLNSTTSELQVMNNATGRKSHDGNDRSESAIPAELITSCVAALLMIQTCTERQYPPADVAQIIDSAVTSLRPCCPQNQPIYREIQMCMGRIKTQILALIPT